MIYFIQAGENGPIKIGHTDNDIEQRIAQLQTGYPYKLKRRWLLEGGKDLESELHERFKHERVNGEWFHPAKTIIEHLIENGDKRSGETLNYHFNYDVIEYPWGIEFRFTDEESMASSIQFNFFDNEIIIYRGGYLEDFEIKDLDPNSLINKGDEN